MKGYKFNEYSIKQRFFLPHERAVKASLEISRNLIFLTYFQVFCHFYDLVMYSCGLLL